MKKIFFIFAMMLMSVVSALAEESYEEFPMTDWVQTYHDEHITVSGDDYDGNGFYISNRKMLTISSNNGEKITRVEYTICWGWDYADRLNASAGNKDVEKSSINDVNATSLTISSDVEDVFQIDYIKVYYESGDDVNNGGNANPFVLDEYVQTETFATTSGDLYIGNNIIVLGSEGDADADGLLVNSTKYLQIHYKNNSLVEILKVDLEFSSDVDGDKLKSNAGGDSDGSGKNWSISNINESSTMITYDGGNAYVKNVKVYYIEANNKTVTIAPTTGDLEYPEGCITVTGTNSSFQYGLDIDNGNSLTITADSDVEILKVDLDVNYYYSGPLGIESSIGNVEGSGDNWTINDVNSSSLTISHPGISSANQVQINNITIYYRQVFAPSTILVTAKKAEVAYWSTFYSSIANYQAPEGTKVYKVNDDGSFITTTEIEDRIVTKGQGVVLKSLTSGNIVMTKVASGSSDDYSGNSLTGTGVAITNPGNAYVLNYKPSSGVGFYKLSSTGTIGANKAYLVSDNVAARAFFAFDIDATTGIDKVNALDSEKEVKAFDLQGRRVAKPAKGLYIVNGKKVIMK